MSLTSILIPTGLALLVLAAVLLVQGGRTTGEAVLLGGDRSAFDGGVSGADGVHHQAAVRGGGGI